MPEDAERNPVPAILEYLPYRRRDGTRQRLIRRIVRQVLFARVEPDERPSLVRHVIANRAPQHGIAVLERIEDRPKRRLAWDVQPVPRRIYDEARAIKARRYSRAVVSVVDTHPLGLELAEDTE